MCVRSAGPDVPPRGQLKAHGGTLSTSLTAGVGVSLASPGLFAFDHFTTDEADCCEEDRQLWTSSPRSMVAVTTVRPGQEEVEGDRPDDPHHHTDPSAPQHCSMLAPPTLAYKGKVPHDVADA